MDNLYINRPLVTIGMPVFNCEKTVGAAICSIQAQTFTDWELIITDDGSTDGTFSVVEQFNDPRIRLIKGQRNLGLPTRLNEAVQLSRGKYFGQWMETMSPIQTDSPPIRIHLPTSGSRPLGGAILVFDAEGRAMGVRQGRVSHEQIRGSFVSSFQHGPRYVAWPSRVVCEKSVPA